jgi:hypothetical protein
MGRYAQNYKKIDFKNYNDYAEKDYERAEQADSALPQRGLVPRQYRTHL